MATKNAIIKVSPAGYVDGDSPAILVVPDADPAHFVAPGANGTWSNATSATAATQDTGMVAAGYLLISIAGTLYRLPAFTTA